MKKKKIIEIKRKKIGRPKGIKRITPLELKRIRRGWKRAVTLDCFECGRKVTIDTDIRNLPIYTKEVRENFVCLFCRTKKKKLDIKVNKTSKPLLPVTRHTSSKLALDKSLSKTKKIIELLKAGRYTMDELAEQSGASKHTTKTMVYCQLKKKGFNIVKSSLKKEGKTTYEIKAK